MNKSPFRPSRSVKSAAYRIGLLALVALGFSFANAASLGAAGTAPMFTSAPAVTFPQSYFGTFTITTSGNPVPTITQTGHLPGGVKFTDNGDGTATLSGRPGNGLGLAGDYALTLKASNGSGTDATQSFTLTITNPPRIVSVNNATFVVGRSNTFAIKAGKTVPKSIVSFTGSLPSGVSFAGGKNGAATLSGTPAAGTEGTYIITITAKNGTLPNGMQTFTLTVQDAVPISRAPAITSAATTTFTAGVEGTFTVRTTGLPTSTITLTGTQPEWLTLIDNTDGTATLVGAPDLGGPASYTFTLTATNGVSPDAVQTFTLLVLSPSPAITSVNNAIFITGSVNTFTVRTKATSPITSLSYSGSLPSGVTFVANTNGTATLSGTPAGLSGGTYPLVITGTNGTLPNATQDFTLTVQSTPPVLHAPAITSAAAKTFSVGVAGSFKVTTTGTPTSQVSLTGSRPSWLSFVDNTDGTATLSGTPDSGSDDSYTFTVTASNGVLPSATQTFLLTVTQAPAFTTPANATFTVATPGIFNVETRANPVAALTKTGSLPGGVSFSDDGDGTAMLEGTPAAGSAGSYSITITAANGITPNATQTFALTIEGSGTPTPTPNPSGTPTPTPNPSGTPTPTPNPSATPTPTPTRLLNISTRLLTKTGDNVAIGGFIISGSAKTVLIRGLGPSLAAFLANTAQDLTLELHDGSSIIASNDDWQETTNVGQIPSGFEPGDPRESVIIATLPPAPYTVIQATKDAAGGIGLLEIYDLDPAGDGMLANISTRGLVETDNEIMIGGFILGSGSEATTVVVRAIGPSLAAFGVANTLADPKLELHDGNGGLIQSNDNWGDDAAQADELTTLGFAPSNDLESAIVASLPPAAYTAIVVGNGGGTGVGLVEVYNLP